MQRVQFQGRKEMVDVLRSSWSQDGSRIFLLHDPMRGKYRLATRYRWLTMFHTLADAADAFEALELSNGDVVALSKWLPLEIQRVPRHQFGSAARTMSRIAYLCNCIERRLAGLRPKRTGSKGSVEVWVPAT